MKQSEINRATRRTMIPASFAQESIWQYCQTDEGMTAYFKSEVNRIVGPLDAKILQDAISYVVGRHESLRSRVATFNGKVVQLIDEFNGISVPIHDLAPGADPEADAIKISQDMITGYAREEQPLFQFAILRVTPGEHWLLYACHQLAWDQWSSRIFLLELVKVYEDLLKGEPPSLPAHGQIQYGDFSAWQRSRLGPDSEGYREALEWWGEHFRSAQHAAAFPFARQEIRTDVDPREGMLEWVLDGATREAVIALRRSAKTSLFVTWLAAATAVLTNKEAGAGLTVGSYVSCRSLDPAANQMIGMFINLVAYHLCCDRTLSFCDWTRVVHQVVANAQARSEIPHEELRMKLAEAGVAMPEVKLIFGAPMNIEGDLEFAGLVLSRQVMDLHRALEMPWGISISICNSSDDSLCWFNANTYDPAGVHKLVEDIKLLLREAASRPTESLSSLLAARVPASHQEQLLEQQAP